MSRRGIRRGLRVRSRRRGCTVKEQSHQQGRCVGACDDLWSGEPIRTCGDPARLEDLRPAVGEVAVAQHNRLLASGELASTRLHSEGAAAGDDDDVLGVVGQLDCGGKGMGGRRGLIMWIAEARNIRRQALEKASHSRVSLMSFIASQNGFDM